MEKPLLPETPKLQVIGAGWGRTGTNSVKLALEKLLDGPCYHMFECVKRPDFQLWIDAYNGKKPEWDKIFTHKDGGTYKATLDYPACGMYRELMEAYPDAKVLLTVRDPEKWYDSVIDTIWSWRCAEQNWSVRIFQAGRNFQTQAQLFHKATMLPGVKRTDREGSIQSFKAWVERVKSTVPPEKLLVFDVKEGWEPLCKFLNLPVPDEPFPNVNDRESLIKDMNKTLVFCYTCNFIALLMALGVAYGLVRLAQFLA
ncbi:unnamed protein product [Effrenium voratum]|nr:unnamed protein product [Effrenium voratum]|mmetsp:Transcript_40070/g.95720  ORF Transcript_40070/g.95720 Transcript_40070/m.95720 type:complete len:256 (-) Transcript_40070:129-896(-)